MKKLSPEELRKRLANYGKWEKPLSERLEEKAKKTLDKDKVA